MLRVEVSEDGQPALPAIDLDDAMFVIGSDPAARVRLPVAAARPDHVRIERGIYRSHEGFGPIGDGQTFAIGNYRVRVAPAPAGAVATPPQRTESLARELMRKLLGTDGAPTLEIERGPVAGGKRALAPPESTLVIGRGDDATWVILDADLSKRHAEIRRGWDGVRVVDLDSKNGTRLDGIAVREGELRDGALVELGNVILRYRDPAERHLAANPPAPSVELVRARLRTAAHPIIFYVAIAIAVSAVAGIVWIVST